MRTRSREIELGPTFSSLMYKLGLTPVTGLLVADLPDELPPEALPHPLGSAQDSVWLGLRTPAGLQEEVPGPLGRGSLRLPGGRTRESGHRPTSETIQVPCSSQALMSLLVRAYVMKLKIVLEPSEEGGYTAYVPTLPGCISEGDTAEEAMDNIRETIELYLEPVDDDLAGKEGLQVHELIGSPLQGSDSAWPRSS
ncbi:MAG: type II toxin-antitoxin system HicB family antitoxin [bacterium]|nr:type II toxin-antitoxin system HicB family antitoxin [bacterium]